jgi:tetratricopeptide (TPR) repeat protein
MVKDPSTDRLQELVNLYENGHLKTLLGETGKMLLEFPRSAALYNIQGVAYASLGHNNLALEAYKKVLSINPKSAATLNNMGNIFLALEKPKEALRLFVSALKIQPEYVEVFNNMGNTYSALGYPDKAVRAFRQAINLDKNYAEAHFNIGNVFKQIGQLDAAIKAYKKALNINPDYSKAYIGFGSVLKDLGNFAAALEAFEAALKIHPEFDEAYINLGKIFDNQGKSGKALEAFQKALCINPDSAEAHRCLSMVKNYSSKDDQYFHIYKMLDEPNLNDGDRCRLNSTLFKIYDDLGDFHSAFKSLEEGNNIRKVILKYSINKDKTLFTNLKKTRLILDQKKLVTERKNTDTGIMPIFIVGMPRSGTTVVEQIISSHSEIHGSGELLELPFYGRDIATGLVTPTKKNITMFRDNYLSQLRKKCLRKNLITDKLPHNFLYVALICSAFPEAKIIHVHRCAIATCWSNYKHYFSSDGLGYSYNLQDISSYYELYDDLMTYWNSFYKDRIYNLNYEQLINDNTNEIRQLIEYLEVDSQEACFSPHKNKRAVDTASSRQVRVPLYKGSSETWKNYEPYLKGAFGNLIV